MQSRTCPLYNSYIAIRLSLSIYVYFINYKPCSSYSHLTYLGPRLGYCQSLHIHEVKRPIILRTYPVSLVVYVYNYYTVYLMHVYKLGLWLRLECSLDSLSIDSAHVIYVSEGFDVPRDYRSRRGRETIKRYDVTETYSHVDNIKYSHVNLIGS